jgi:hypothetical protein
MLTIKHMKDADHSSVFSTPAYDKVSIDGRTSLTFRIAGYGNVTIDCDHGETIFIENISGKTIDVIKG